MRFISFLQRQDPENKKKEIGAMAEYIFITEDVQRWFWPLLPDSELRSVEQNSSVYAIGAVEESTACGVLLFELADRMLQINYLIVADGYRRQGIGTGMVQYLCRLADEDVIPVICVFAASGAEAPLYRLFADMWNFSVAEQDGYYCRVPLPGLKGNAMLASMRGIGAAAVPFFTLSEPEQISFRRKLLEQNVYFLQDIPDEDFVEELCMCRRTSTGAISAAVFFTRAFEEDDLELAFAWAAPGGQKDLMGLFGQVSSLLSDRESGYLNIAAVSSFSVSLVEKIFPEKEIIRKYYQAAWDMEIEEG